MEGSREKNSGKVFSINISAKKGISKTQTSTANLIENFGIEGDVHAGDKTRQVSLLSWESISQQQACPKVNPIRSRQGGTNGARKQEIEFKPGDFAENITTQGLNLAKLKIGDRLIIKDTIILEVSQIGKECHNYCEIFKKIGTCIMPKEGIFTKVIKGGQIAVGDNVDLCFPTKKKTANRILPDKDYFLTLY